MKFLTLLLLVCSTSFLSAQSNQATRIDSLFGAMLEAQTFNGVVLFAEDGKVIHKKAYGYSNYQTKEPLTVESVFDLASVSKQFTAMGIALLEHQKKLSYQDPLGKFIPELSFYKGITIEHLLTHTAGLPDYMKVMSEHWDHSQIATNQDVIDLFAELKPKRVFEPRSDYEYSNTGYLLLATVIEKASGMSYGDFLEHHIFDPLGMTNTTLNRPRFAPKDIKNLTKGHVTGISGFPVLTESLGTDHIFYFLDGIVGDGMVNSTVDDLFLWDRALYEEQLLPKNKMEPIFTSYTLQSGKETGYGYGWIITEDSNYGKRTSHSGGWAGYTTYIERHTDNNKVFIILQNMSTYTTQIPVKNCRKILYNEPIEIIKYIDKTYSVAELRPFIGVYKNAEIGMDITTTVSNGVLTAQATGQSSFPLKGYENKIFKFDMAGIVITFSEDFKTLYLKQGNQTTVFKK